MNDNTSLSEFMARIDERTKTNSETLVALETAFVELKRDLKKEFVTIDAFQPVSRIAYGMVYFLCFTVASAFIVGMVAIIVKIFRG